MKIIQQLNGEKGSNRYIISNCSSLEDVLILFALIRITMDSSTIDIILYLKLLLIWKNQLIFKDFMRQNYIKNILKLETINRLMLGFLIN